MKPRNIITIVLISIFLISLINVNFQSEIEQERIVFDSNIQFQYDMKDQDESIPEDNRISANINETRRIYDELMSSSPDEGNDTDVAYDIYRSNVTGRTYVTGWTYSDKFFETGTTSEYETNLGRSDAFFIVFESVTLAVLYSTHWGGSDYDFAYAIDVREDIGIATIFGETISDDLPCYDAQEYTPEQVALNGTNYDCFLATFNISSNAANYGWTLYSTYLGSAEDDKWQDGEIVGYHEEDPDTNIVVAYVVGTTESNDTFPGTLAPSASNPSPLINSFLINYISVTSNDFVFTWVFGGEDHDELTALELQQDRCNYTLAISGFTKSNDSDFLNEIVLDDSMNAGGFDGYLAMILFDLDVSLNFMLLASSLKAHSVGDDYLMDVTHEQYYQYEDGYDYIIKQRLPVQSYVLSKGLMEDDFNNTDYDDCLYVNISEDSNGEINLKLNFSIYGDIVNNLAVQYLDYITIQARFYSGDWSSEPGHNPYFYLYNFTSDSWLTVDPNNHISQNHSCQFSSEEYNWSHGCDWGLGYIDLSHFVDDWGNIRVMILDNNQTGGQENWFAFDILTLQTHLMTIENWSYAVVGAGYTNDTLLNVDGINNYQGGEFDAIGAMFFVDNETPQNWVELYLLNVGGGGNDQGYFGWLDRPSQDLFLTMNTNSSIFTTANSTLNCSYDVYLAKLNFTEMFLYYSTLLEPADDDSAYIYCFNGHIEAAESPERVTLTGQVFDEFYGENTIDDDAWFLTCCCNGETWPDCGSYCINTTITTTPSNDDDGDGDDGSGGGDGSGNPDGERRRCIIYCVDELKNRIVNLQVIIEDMYYNYESLEISDSQGRIILDLMLSRDYKLSLWSMKDYKIIENQITVNEVLIQMNIHETTYWLNLRHDIMSYLGNSVSDMSENPIIWIIGLVTLIGIAAALTYLTKNPYILIGFLPIIGVWCLSILSISYFLIGLGLLAGALLILPISKLRKKEDNTIGFEEAKGRLGKFTKPLAIMGITTLIIIVCLI